MTNDWCYGVNDNILEEEWEHTQTCYTENQTTDSEALIPCCIVKFVELWIRNLLEKNLTYNTKDVNSCYYNRGCCDDG